MTAAVEFLAALATAPPERWQGTDHTSMALALADGLCSAGLRFLQPLFDLLNVIGSKGEALSEELFSDHQLTAHVRWPVEVGGHRGPGVRPCRRHGPLEQVALVEAQVE